MATDRGHNCCGCCCDVRRATIVVNILLIIVAVINTVVIFSFAAAARELDANNYASIHGLIVALILHQIFSIILNALAIIDAARFKANFVLANIVYMLIGLIYGSILVAKASAGDSNYGENSGASIAISVIITLLFVYPQAVYVSEVRNKIMTPENYANVESSCCCV